MVRLDVIGGLLGAGKTTLIRRMLSTAYQGYKTAIVENEAGKVNLDGEILKSPSVTVKEISSGCICCTLKGSFSDGVRILCEQEKPDYIVVEPSGAADLTGVVNACLESGMVRVNRVIMVVNARRILKLLKVVGDFYLQQIKRAEMLYLNFSEGMSHEDLQKVEQALLKINPHLAMISTPLEEIEADTFPEGLSWTGTGKKSPAEKVSTARNPEGFVRIHRSAGQELVSWSGSLRGGFTEEEIEKLLGIFQEETFGDIWRVKGCLTMKDGKVKKVDVAFGDAFQEDLEEFPSEKTNLLVVTGKTLHLALLKERLGCFLAKEQD